LPAPLPTFEIADFASRPPSTLLTGKDAERAFLLVHFGICLNPRHER